MNIKSKRISFKLKLLFLFLMFFMLTGCSEKQIEILEEQIEVLEQQNESMNEVIKNLQDKNDELEILIERLRTDGTLNEPILNQNLDMESIREDFYLDNEGINKVNLIITTLLNQSTRVEMALGDLITVKNRNYENEDFYDSQGNIIRTRNVKYNNNGEVSFIIYMYLNGNGKMEFIEQFYYSKNGSIDKYEYYNENDKLITSIYFSNDINNEISTIIKNNYNEFGKLTSLEQFKYLYNSSNEVEDIQYDFQNNSHKSFELSVYLRNNTLTRIKLEYYDSNEKLTSSKVLKYFNDGSLNSISYYNSEYLRTRADHYKEDELIITWYYYYDDNKKEIKAERFDPNGELALIVYRFYDENGDMLRQDNYRANGVIVQRYHYVKVVDGNSSHTFSNKIENFDVNGNLISTIHYNLDGSYSHTTKHN